ncbi:MAG: dihydropteroate synthase [Bacteroidetes bacterium]|nr:MAG: dihydropteroate synthase [Bacteroidota bacterium]TAG94705.1 MAG: dihydropteroate synthase [Bacteroidota bacterium]
MFTLNLNGELLVVKKPLVFGILNITPDSFYAESRYQNETQILNKASQMLTANVDFLDIGGYSTRPNADDISEEEEKKRVLDTILLIKKHFPTAKISVDTFRSNIAKASVEMGASIVNDISGGNLDEKMFEVVSQLNVPYILMHSKGTPKTMQNLTDYDNIIAEMIDYFQTKITQLRTLGQKDIIIDLGFGFAKTIAQNYYLLKNMALFEVLNCPILVGISRKSMIYKPLQITAEDALNGTSALHIIALQNHASCLRVHDVKEAKQIIDLWELMNVD